MILLHFLHLDLFVFAGQTSVLLCMPPKILIIIIQAHKFQSHFNYKNNNTAMSSDQFRRILEQFYIRINTYHHVDVYKKILSQLFDEVEVEPIHVLTITEQPTMKNMNLLKKENRKRECLYKGTDFASVFLFGFLLNMLQNGDKEYFKQLQKRVMDNLDMFYGDKQTDDSIKYKFIFEGIFDFCQSLLTKSYQRTQIQQLFKALYGNTFQRRGLKKNQKQKFQTEAQTILSFIMGNGGIFPTKKQMSDLSSDIYQLNNLQFCINIQNIDQNQQWTIGEGENHINIAKQKGEYYVYQQQVEMNVQPEQQMSQAWANILSQSLQIKKQQYEKTSKIFVDLNIAEISSPAKSMRSPKSMMVKNGVKRAKIGDFF